MSKLFLSTLILAVAPLFAAHDTPREDELDDRNLYQMNQEEIKEDQRREQMQDRWFCPECRRPYEEHQMPHEGNYRPFSQPH